MGRFRAAYRMVFMRCPDSVPYNTVSAGMAVAEGQEAFPFVCHNDRRKGNAKTNFCGRDPSL